jgi:hypothetical protein
MYLLQLLSRAAPIKFEGTRSGGLSARPHVLFVAMPAKPCLTKTPTSEAILDLGARLAYPAHAPAGE